MKTYATDIRGTYGLWAYMPPLRYCDQTYKGKNM